MIYRSKAPLRIGLAGGGTDVSPYSDEFGGAILNATLSLHAHANIELIEEHKIIIQSIDQKEEQLFDWSDQLPVTGKLDLLKGVFNRIQHVDKKYEQDYCVGRINGGGCSRAPGCQCWRLTAV